MRLFRRSLVSCLVALAPLASASSALAVSAEVRDFLIQDVCVNAQDQPIVGDPYTCLTHRDLRLGEKIPYRYTDSENGAVYQSVFSFPVRSPNLSDPNPRVVVAKEFGGNDVGTAFRDFDRCTGGNCTPVYRDGYDVAEMNGTYVSFVGTSDPGINNQSFWRKGCPSGTSDPSWNEDGWILFPATITQGVQGNVTHYLNITTNNKCPSSFNAAHVAWDYRSQPVTYTSGKSMTTITSHHFAGTGTNNATSFEMFYFTKQYGFTRWEVWRRSDQCGSGGCVPKVHGCNGDTSAVISGQTFIRLDCRDSTYVVNEAFPLETAPFVASPQLSRTQNLVKGGTFANAMLEPGWDRLSPQTTTNWTFMTGQHTPNNVSLAFACAGSCASNSVYHDATVTSLNGGGTQTVRYGAALKVDAAPSGLYMVAHLFNLSGAHIESRTQYFDVQTSFAAYENSFGWDFNAQPLSKIRVEFYPQAANRDYHLDEVFLVGQ
ncbi:hypothetical protein [Chondromyces apiculatus]|uniref:Secreted protein n=1 Tax=Chondromyces apiculatus DSM 436 TaxID=1192034 RepID=A0A017SWW7_9BACT|nr:hypothetical protein [Chondromyces apiculatus]EYF01065.1 Hypothetical protein CAP_8722 [Chondromyces apiculatus DSM 436]